MYFLEELAVGDFLGLGRLRTQLHLRKGVKLLVQDDQHRLNRDIVLEVAEVSWDVLVEHLIGNLHSSFHVALTDKKVRNEVLQHD